MNKCLIVERQKLRENIRCVKQAAGSAEIYGVLKGNGYGLGMLDLADTLRQEGISRFAITEVRDLILLRNSGFIDEEVLVMRSTSLPEEVEKLIEYNAVASVGSYETAMALNGIAEKNNAGIDAHIVIDTGMGRYGFCPEETEQVLNIYKYLSTLNVTGMYTHFNRAFSSHRATVAQLESFQGVAETVRAAGYNPGTLHAANSCALFRYPETVLDAVRVGSALTGRLAVNKDYGLQKVGYAQAQIIEVRWVPKGHTIGYGADYVCKRRTKIAVLPIGYGDGVCTQKSRDIFTLNKSLHAAVHEMKLWLKHTRMTGELNGKTVRVLGHVGMQHVIVDATDVHCVVGDKVKLNVNPVMTGTMLPKCYV